MKTKTSCKIAATVKTCFEQSLIGRPWSTYGEVGDGRVVMCNGNPELDFSKIFGGSKMSFEPLDREIVEKQMFWVSKKTVPANIKVAVLYSPITEIAHKPGCDMLKGLGFNAEMVSYLQVRRGRLQKKQFDVCFTIGADVVLPILIRSLFGGAANTIKKWAQNQSSFGWKNVKKFVEAGGGAVWECAGSAAGAKTFNAGGTAYNMLGLLPVETECPYVSGMPETWNVKKMLEMAYDIFANPHKLYATVTYRQNDMGISEGEHEVFWDTGIANTWRAL